MFVFGITNQAKNVKIKKIFLEQKCVLSRI